MKEHDYSVSYRNLHDKDPVDYHANRITCEWCGLVLE